MKVNLNKIKQLRTEHGFTHAEVSKYLGFKSQQGYFYKENGIRDFSAVELGKVAALFGVTADDLLEADEPDELPPRCSNA